MTQENVIAVLIGLLSDKSDLEMRIAAVDGLGYTGLTDVRTVLLQIVDDKQEEKTLRRAAARALGRTVCTSK